MRKIVLGSVALVALAAGNSALAADMAPVYKAAPPPPVVWSWSGVYVGINVGGSVSRNGTRDTGVYAATALPASVTLYNESFYNSPAGWIAGGQIGFNVQVAPGFVVGAEADWQGSGQKSSTCVFTCGATTAAFFGPGGAGFNNALEDEQRLRSFGTARVRAGVATNSWLWYVTGGAAWGRVQNHFALTSNNVVGTLFVPGTSVADFSHNKGGWTVGGGVETQLWGNWSAKLEYLYVDLGNVTDSFTIPAGTALAGATFTTTTSYRFTDHIIRAGLNYKFDWGPVVAKY